MFFLFQFVGPSCGHHASYSFFKAIKYQKNGKQKILSLGEFFFVKIWNDSDIVSIGELQLLWEDRNTNQVLSSLRLYFLPEYTPEGRLDSHGEVRHHEQLIIISTVLHGPHFSLLRRVQQNHGWLLDCCWSLEVIFCALFFLWQTLRQGYESLALRNLESHLRGMKKKSQMNQWKQTESSPSWRNCSSLWGVGWMAGRKWDLFRFVFISPHSPQCDSWEAMYSPIALREKKQFSPFYPNTVSSHSSSSFSNLWVSGIWANSYNTERAVGAKQVVGDVVMRNLLDLFDSPAFLIISGSFQQELNEANILEECSRRLNLFFVLIIGIIFRVIDGGVKR